MLKEKQYYGFEDVLIKSKFSKVNSRNDVGLTLDLSEHKNKIFYGWNPVPIMSANMDTVTDITMAKELLKRNWIPVLHKYVSKMDICELFDWLDHYNLNAEQPVDYRNIFISRGSSDRDKEKLIERLNSEPRIKSVCIDVANGHREDLVSYAKELKDTICKDKVLMVGNIGSKQMLKSYEEAGVDIVKAGIGPGSACITRVKTGVGTPQISLIDEVSQVDKDSKMLIVSDGGCKVEGDIVKAFVAGADFVMIGGMLAGFKESPGSIDVIDGKKYKRFSGMAAKESQHEGVPSHGTEEGKTVSILYRGKVYHKLEDIEGGIRSACTYTNCEKISQLNEVDLIISKSQENKVFA